MVVDGSRAEDLYMVDMFREVFADEDPATYVWDGNYHQPWEPAAAGGVGTGAYREVEAEDPGRLAVEALVRTRRCVCVAQRWGGKREVMYTAFKALGDSVDYVQVSGRCRRPTCDLTPPPPMGSFVQCRVSNESLPSFIHSTTQRSDSFIPSFIQSREAFIHSSTHSLIHPFIVCSFIHSFIQRSGSFIHSTVTHSFIRAACLYLLAQCKKSFL
jgi:hypothetical protein